MRTAARPLITSAAALAALAACGKGPGGGAGGNVQAKAEADSVDIPQDIAAEAPGTTPMAQRTAVIGLLNKRNGISRELVLKPGQAIRIGDAIVRLRACETTAPWEAQKLTGAFVQLDVRDPQGQFHRIFSGWLYKESPSLNVLEHPVYDVWPKSCAMTHPEAAADTVRAGSPASSRSSAPNSPPRTRPSPAPAPAEAAPASPPPSAESNSAR